MTEYILLLKKKILQITRRGTKKQIQDIQIKYLFSLPKMFESETKIHRKKTILSN